MLLTRLQVADEEGQDLAEYALIIALVVIAAIVGIAALSGAISGVWATIAGALGG